MPVRLNYSNVTWIDFGVGVIDQIRVWLLKEQRFPEFYDWNTSLSHLRAKNEILEFVNLEVLEIDWRNVPMVEYFKLNQISNERFIKRFVESWNER